LSTILDIDVHGQVDEYSCAFRPLAAAVEVYAPRMERRQLEYFLALVEHGGFTNAARVLHVSQPSLSHAITSLETELGGALFHRLPHGAMLTPAGEALVSPAGQVARDVSTATAAVREVIGLSGGRLDIVAQTTLAVDPLSALLGEFLRRHPLVTVRVSDPVQGSRVGQLVRSGESELGLVDSEVPVGDLESTLLADQILQLVMPPGHPAQKMGISELAKTRFVVPPPGAGTRVILEQALRKAGLSLVISVETAHRAMIVPLVLAGAGAAVLPRSMAADAATKGAVVVATDPRLHHRGRLVWRPGQLSPAAEKFTAVTSAYTETRGAPMDAL
jgi:DNA-binding transcriptional LysR family regulator